MPIWTPNSRWWQVSKLDGESYPIPGVDAAEAKQNFALLTTERPESLEAWLLWRFMARMNLLFLCRRVLGYVDVSTRVHGRVLDNVQKFQPSTEDIAVRNITGLKTGHIAIPKMKELIAGFHPGCELYDLPGSRRQFYNMIPRGHLKTTVITSAHSIQFVLNYPDVRLCLDSHTDGNVKKFLSEIKAHWTKTEMFRFLFPEHVPQGKAVNEFGNQEFFDTLARTNWKKEHTYNILSVGSAAAGSHYDAIFHDDLVDKETIKTPDQIQTTKDHLAACDPLIHRQNTPHGAKRGWEYLTGTFYDFSDVNYSIYEDQKEKPESERTWSLNVQSAAPNWPDPDGPVLWPERFPYAELKAIELDPAKGPAMLAAQYLMNPIPPGSGLIDDAKELIFTPRKVMNELYARLALYVAVDLAGMEAAKSKSSDNDYSAITLGGFGTDGHLYVIECVHGRPSPERVIDELFAMFTRHPRIQQIKVEKEAHARVLLKFLKAEEAKRGVWLPIMELQRDNQQSKQQKIRGLQPWFKRGMIHFADDLPCKGHIINEVMRFPKYNHDDILDTLCDLMASRDGRVTHEVMGLPKEAPQGSGSFLQEMPFLQMFGDKLPEEAPDSITGWY